MSSTAPHHNAFAAGLVFWLYSLAHMRFGRAGRLGVDLTIAALLVGGFYVGTATAHDRGWLNSVLCEGSCPAELIVEPTSLPPVSATENEPTAPGDALIDGEQLQAAVADALRSGDLGERVGFLAVDARDGSALTTGGGTAQMPASTTKILTSFAALSLIDPQTRFTTRVDRAGDTIFLVGGGDPFLTDEPTSTPSRTQVADLKTLAQQTAEAVGDDEVQVAFDVSLFSGPGDSPQWEDSYIDGDIVTPISPLWIDLGVTAAGRSQQPAIDATERFVEFLRAEGVRVSGQRGSAVSPDNARSIAQVESATLSTVVESLMKTSNNEVTEVVARLVAVAAGRPGSFDGAVQTIAETLDDAGIDTSGLVLYDGSGLSRQNRISPSLLTSTLAAAADQPDLAAVISGLPVGGFDGTLRLRFGDLPAGQGAVRAKTGTLTGTHALAGIVTLSGGRPVAFAVIADQTADINASDTRTALDAVAAAIAGCSCELR